MSRGFHLTRPETVTLHGWKAEATITLQLGLMLDGAVPALLDAYDVSGLQRKTSLLYVVDGAVLGFRSVAATTFNGGLYATTTRCLRAFLAEIGIDIDEGSRLTDAYFASGRDPERSALTMMLSDTGLGVFDALTAHSLISLRKKGILLPEAPARPA